MQVPDSFRCAALDTPISVAQRKMGERNEFLAMRNEFLAMRNGKMDERNEFLAKRSDWQPELPFQVAHGGWEIYVESGKLLVLGKTQVLAGCGCICGSRRYSRGLPQRMRPYRHARMPS